MRNNKEDWANKNGTWDAGFHSKSKKNKALRKGKKGKKAINTESCKEPEVKNNKYTVEGLITNSLGNGMFRVCLDLETEKRDVLASISGKIRIEKILIIPGDRVLLQIDKKDITKGLITFRLT